MYAWGSTPVCARGTRGNTCGGGKKVTAPLQAVVYVVCCMMVCKSCDTHMLCVCVCVCVHVCV